MWYTALSSIAMLILIWIMSPFHLLEQIPRVEPVPLWSWFLFQLFWSPLNTDSNSRKFWNRTTLNGKWKRWNLDASIQSFIHTTFKVASMQLHQRNIAFMSLSQNDVEHSTFVPHLKFSLPKETRWREGTFPSSYCRVAVWKAAWTQLQLNALVSIAIAM